MTEITDDFMRSMLGRTRTYTIVLLTRGPNYGSVGSDAIVWEHGRRNFRLRDEGLLSVVCPITDDGDVRGLAIFTGDVDEVRAIMDGDPGVQAGLFEYSLHPCRSFPGDSLAQ